MDWTQWGKGEERPQSSAGCEILEAPVTGEAQGFRQCQLAHWSRIRAGERRGYFRCYLVRPGLLFFLC